MAVVWVGFDDGTPLGLSGARAALPIWTDFMRAAASLEYPGDFTVPPTVAFPAGLWQPVPGGLPALDRARRALWLGHPPTDRW